MLYIAHDIEHMATEDISHIITHMIAAYDSVRSANGNTDVQDKVRQIMHQVALTKDVSLLSLSTIASWSLCIEDSKLFNATWKQLPSLSSQDFDEKIAPHLIPALVRILNNPEDSDKTVKHKYDIW